MPPLTDIKEALPLPYLEIGEGEVPRERVSESAGPKALTCARIRLRVTMLRDSTRGKSTSDWWVSRPTALYAQ